MEKEIRENRTWKRFGLRTTIAVVALAVSVVSFAGCGGSESSNDGRVTITFWHSFVSGSIPALRELIARFEEEHPGIRINAQYIPTGDALIQKLITSVRSNSAPDISWIRAHYMEEMVKADAIYEMSHFIDGPNGFEEGELEDFYPALLQYSSWQGTLYCLPMEATNLGLLYNKGQFREVGLDPERPPQTWDELREYSRRLTRDLNGDGQYDRVGFAMPAVPATGPNGPYMMWTWFPWLWQAGGWLVNEDQSKVIFDEAPGVQALSFWKELYDMQQLRNFTNDWVVAFTSKQAAMIMDGPWNLPRYDDMFDDIEWGIGMLPEGPEKRATIVGGEYLAIFKQSKNPDEAWAFVKWMTRPDIQAWWSMKSGYLPVRRSSMEDPEFQAFLADNPGHRAFAEQMDYAVAQRPLDYHTEDIQRLVAKAMEQALVGGQDPQTVLRQAANESNALLRAASSRQAASN